MTGCISGKIPYNRVGAGIEIVQLTVMTDRWLQWQQSRIRPVLYIDPE